MRAITLDEAIKIITETFAEAKRRNAYPLTAVLLDAGGRMKMRDEAGRRLAAALRGLLRQGLCGAGHGPRVAPGAAEGQGQAAVHAVVRGACRRSDVPRRRRPARSATARAK